VSARETRTSLSHRVIWWFVLNRPLPNCFDANTRRIDAAAHLYCRYKGTWSDGARSAIRSVRVVHVHTNAQVGVRAYVCAPVYARLDRVSAFALLPLMLSVANDLPHVPHVPNVPPVKLRSACTCIRWFDYCLAFLSLSLSLSIHLSVSLFLPDRFLSDSLAYVRTLQRTDSTDSAISPFPAPLWRRKLNSFLPLFLSRPLSRPMYYLTSEWIVAILSDASFLDYMRKTSRLRMHFTDE